MSKVRYALVGTGSRSAMFADALLGRFSERHELVALLDGNPERLRVMNAERVERSGRAALPGYAPAHFRRMLDEQRVDVAIVTSIDRTHHEYIVAALEAGRDVISEKPMTIDAEKCAAVLRAVASSGRTLRVAFNYRYAPQSAQIKELLASGAIGEVLSVHFEWLLDTSHGADYFRRWHRDKRNSGGLMVHKATHHFDLVNWWLGSRPECVFGFGALRYYGRENAESRGVAAPYARYTGSPAAALDPFALDLSTNEPLRKLYLGAEQHDGYQRDQNVFGDGISIEDDMAVLVRYESRATLSYHLTAYSPWEGFRVAFNGTRGRLEYELTETPWVKSPVAEAPAEFAAYPAYEAERARLLLRPHWGPPRQVPLASGEGDHGGGDARLLEDLFEPRADVLGRAANHVDGAWSIVTGIAANRAFETGRPVRVRELLQASVDNALGSRGAAH